MCAEILYSNPDIKKIPRCISGSIRPCASLLTPPYIYRYIRLKFLYMFLQLPFSRWTTQLSQIGIIVRVQSDVNGRGMQPSSINAQVLINLPQPPPRRLQRHQCCPRHRQSLRTWSQLLLLLRGPWQRSQSGARWHPLYSLQQRRSSSSI